MFDKEDKLNFLIIRDSILIFLVYLTKLWSSTKLHASSKSESTACKGQELSLACSHS